MRIQQLPETAEQFPSLEAPTLGVYKHEERAAIRRQLRVLRGGGLNYVGIKGPTLELLSSVQPQIPSLLSHSQSLLRLSSLHTYLYLITDLSGYLFS